MFFDTLWQKSILHKFTSLQKKILVLKKKTSLLSEQELKDKFDHFRKKIKSTEDANRYLVPVYALVREVIHRQIGILLFPTQVLGGIALHYNFIIQKGTGEGKTVTAFQPICLNATFQLVIMATVNEYLVERDQKLGEKIFSFFGLDSGFNSSGFNSESKKKLYEGKKIVYTTAQELGFDILRNNLVKNKKDIIKNLTIDKNGKIPVYLIDDEADLNRIDGATNPLIISQRSSENTEESQKKTNQTTYLVNNLIINVDYKIDNEDKDVWLTKKGIKKAESFYKINNLFSFINKEINFLLHNSLRAKHFYLKDVDYIVEENRRKIIIIDSLTGRLVPDRVYSTGIQQAIESKENLPVSPQSKSIATITYQNLYRILKNSAGMTGTAQTEAEEFRQVYGMEVITIPPHKKTQRRDLNDLIFLNKESKYEFILKSYEINQQTKKQPILTGSPNLDASEHLSKLLKEKDVFHYKLNAVNHKEEAEIIARAGEKGALTISTNMAGRGTDIILTEESRKIGGLRVDGIERNNLRRLDDQLKGRAGRQGDPGKSQFYVSLEDELIKNHKENFNFLKKGKFKFPIQGKLFNMMIEEIQETMRNLQASYRQNTLNHDLLIDKKRQFIYRYRWKILTEDNLLIFLKKNLHLKREYKNWEEPNFVKWFEEEQEYLRTKIIKDIDKAWANFLEAREKVDSLVFVKHWVPQDVQEAFFWETSRLFKITWQYIIRKIESRLSDSVNNYK